MPKCGSRFNTCAEFADGHSNASLGGPTAAHRRRTLREARQGSMPALDHGKYKLTCRLPCTATPEVAASDVDAELAGLYAPRRRTVKKIRIT